MTAKQWPSNLKPWRFNFEIEGQSQSGGRSDTGFESVVVGSAGRIVASLEFRGIWDGASDTILAARAIKAHMRGRSNTVLIKLEDSFSPGILADDDASAIIQGLDDGTYFDDGTGIECARTPAQAGIGTMGQSSLLVTMSGEHTPQAGQWFGLKGKEAYLIDTAVKYIDDPNMHIWVLTFAPTLRSDVADGEPVSFENILIEMRANSDQVAQLNFEPPYRVSNMTLSLVEAPNL